MSESLKSLAEGNNNNWSKIFNESDITEALTQPSFETFFQEIDVKDESQFTGSFLNFLLKNNIITTKEWLSWNSVLWDIMDEKYFKQLQTICKNKTGCKLWHLSEIMKDTLVNPSTIDDLYAFVAFAPFLEDVDWLKGKIQLRDFCVKLKANLVRLGWIEDKTLYLEDKPDKNQKASDFKALLDEKQFHIMMKALTEVGWVDVDNSWFNGEKYRWDMPITFPLVYKVVF